MGHNVGNDDNKGVKEGRVSEGERRRKVVGGRRICGLTVWMGWFVLVAHIANRSATASANDTERNQEVGIGV
jgi:hypothetical protein